MTNLTPEDRVLGRENANRALGVSRRDLLKAAAAAPALGAFYFGYADMKGKSAVRAAIIGTGDEGCQAMIRSHNREYLDFIGYCDIRPSQQERAVKEFSNHKDYSSADVKKLKRYATKEDMYNDTDVEMIVIALPLWLHAPVAIEAMNKGKHVFTEKLMGHSVAECKEMCQVARKTNRLLAVGHQRHYSVLYDNANYLVQNNVLGDIRHIRALWHRNNAQPLLAKDKNGNPIYDPKTGVAEYVYDEDKKVVYRDSWKRIHKEEDKNIDYKKFGYNSLDELINWRLYNRTGAGLMAELGSHQLDACSIFLGKKHPLAVTGIGGTFFYTDGREVDDHVFTVFEFPGTGEKDRVVVTYSSINTNSFDGYGEQVMGSKGTMLVSQEKEILLFKEAGSGALSKSTSVTAGNPRQEAGPRDQPEHRRPDRRGRPGRPGDGRSVAWLSRRARAFRLLRAPRQHVGLSRRQRSPAALSRRGRPGRRGDRAHEQPRDAAKAADRLRPPLV